MKKRDRDLLIQKLILDLTHESILRCRWAASAGDGGVAIADARFDFGDHRNLSWTAYREFVVARLMELAS